MSIVTAAASRPYPGETANGDRWSIDWHEGRCRIALIDGLGHGSEAAAVAALAGAALAERPALGPVDALSLCQRALAGTRGAAISVAAIDAAGASLSYAGIGNVEAQLWQEGRSHRPIAYRGIVGVTQQRPRSFELSLAAPWLLLMYTDGIQGRVDVAALPETLRADAGALAEHILATWGRLQDDATIVVAQGTSADRR